ncbi:MAG: DUF885 domain-containing protein [Lachnospiraceae bacterium]
MKPKKYTPILFISSILILLILYACTKDSLPTICNDYALQSLENNPIELHYSIAYPEQMDFTDLSTNLLPYTSTYYEECALIFRSYLSRLEALDTSSFSSDELLTYNLLYESSTAQLSLLQYPYLENPLSSFNGIHNQLPILLAEYDFRNISDIDNYLLLLSEIPAYFEGLALYANEQSQAGILLCKDDVSESIEQCLSLFSFDEVNSSTHFLNENFNAKIQSLLESNLLSSDEVNSYIAKHNQYLIEYIYPAYQTLASTLESLTVQETLLGLYYYENGADYYEVLLQSKIGSNQSIAEIKQLLYEDFETLYETYYSLVTTNTITPISDFPFTSAEEMLQDLCESLTNDFPTLPTNSDSQMNIQVKEVEKNMQEMSAPAFYLIPPIDASMSNTIYINPGYELEGLDLYTTLAHEGFPGHLYQTVYSQLHLTEQNTPLARQLLYHGGFTEGWGIYSEMCSYEFIVDVLPAEYKNAVLYESLSRKIQLCLSSILDIAIHYEGATVTEVQSILESLDFNGSIASTLYESICLSPGNYPMYYVGYLNIMALKKSAKELWSSSYTDLTFHTWILETGGGDFNSLNKALYSN